MGTNKTSDNKQYVGKTDKEVFRLISNKFSCILTIPGKKKPITSGWVHASRRRSVVSYIPEGCNLGVVAGVASNILIVNVCRPDLFVPFAKKHGFDWSNHFVVEGPRGFHIYFKYSAEVDNYFKEARIDCTLKKFGFELLVRDSFALAPGSRLVGNREYNILHDGDYTLDIPEFIVKEVTSIHLKRREATQGDYSGVKKALSPAKCWVMTKMADRLNKQEGDEISLVSWFADVLAQRGCTTACASAVAEWIDAATDDSFSYIEAYDALMRRLAKTV